MSFSPAQMQTVYTIALEVLSTLFSKFTKNYKIQFTAYDNSPFLSLIAQRLCFRLRFLAILFHGDELTEFLLIFEVITSFDYFILLLLNLNYFIHLKP